MSSSFLIFFFKYIYVCVFCIVDNALGMLRWRNNEMFELSGTKTRSQAWASHPALLNLSFL